MNRSIISIYHRGISIIFPNNNNNNNRDLAHVNCACDQKQQPPQSRAAMLLTMHPARATRVIRTSINRFPSLIRVKINSSTLDLHTREIWISHARTNPNLRSAGAHRSSPENSIIHPCHLSFSAIVLSPAILLNFLSLAWK